MSTTPWPFRSIWPILYFLSFLFPTTTTQASLNPAALTPIREIVQSEIADGKLPGAVVLVSQNGKILFQEAFGFRTTQPETEAMTLDTIFDLASLTKVVCTAPAILQLVEQGKLRLADPAALYWREFGRDGKERITVRDLLTHYSGLPTGLAPNKKNGQNGQNGHAEDILEQIAAVIPRTSPGDEFLYGDLNFIVLGEVVKRVSGESLDSYCTEHIFTPLRLTETGFHPSAAKISRIAPMEADNVRSPRGRVQDPLAAALGGVAGNAGVFSTARDLSRFAEMMLSAGELNGTRVLSPFAIAKLTTPQTPPGKNDLRGLGWDLATAFSTYQGDLFPPGSYGHTGYTGTSLWIDPVTRTTLIILTNRLHPDGRGDVRRLRNLVANVVSAAFDAEDQKKILTARENARHCPGEEEPATAATSSAGGRVTTGIDVLVAESFARLAGKKVGLITNHTGLNREGRRTIDLIHGARQVKLVAIFSPEHGVNGELDEKVGDGLDAATGIPILSLYSGNKRPTDAQLDGIDALIFDIQDVGARFYTYITTLGYCMEAAATKKIPIFVLDRPNPISAAVVQGPLLTQDLRSFAGYFPLPVRHGMTVGELARLFNAEANIRASLDVVVMQGYRRADWFDGTGLLWLPPSPNLRTLAQATLYPGVAIVEGANVSVGRGTDNPFELVGAPWVDGAALADRLSARHIPGVSFVPTRFTPRATRYQKEACQGVQVVLVNREALDAPLLGVELAAALHNLSPDKFNINAIDGMIGTKAVSAAIRAGADPRSIVKGWREEIDTFQRLRRKYLLY